MINVFEPLRIQPPSLRAAVVRVPPASEPACGSVSDQQPSFLPCASGVTYFLRCSARAEFVNVIGAQRIVRGHDQPDRAIDACELFDHRRVLDVTKPRAAVLLRKNHAHQAHFAELRNQFGRKLRGFIPFHDVRSDFRFGEFAHAAAKLLLLVGEGEVQEASMRGVV